MTDSVVVEGYVRFRDGKKWKTRWVALRKPSPVADCLVLLVFKDKSEKAQGHRERASITLEDICGLEVSGQGLEGAPYTLAVLCLTQAAVLGFDSKDTLLAWEVRVRYSLGEVHRFNVGVLPGTKLEGGAATLHICNNLLALARDNPPVIVGHWNLPDLRRYGPVPTGFVFEGGTRCGYWAGVFFLASTEGEHISFLFDCIVRGVSPNRSPFGLRPVLPDPSGGPPVPLQSEEQVTREDQDLERRLSLLSHRYSNALSVYTAGAAGDDRSLSGSSDTSDTSRSDGSVGSRLTVWAEPGPAPGTSDITAAAAAGGPVGFARLSIPSAERLSIGHGGGGGGGGGGGARPLAKPPRPLQEIGRQRSSDSGIATTGSHSSYSGSFSSYTGSLDGVPGEEYAPGAGPAPGPPPGPCTCGSASGRGPAHGHLYDTPRSVARDDDQPRPLAAAPGAEPPPLQSEESEAEGGVTGSLSPPPTPPPPPPHPGHIQAPVQSGDSRGSVVADSSQSYTSMTGCSVCPTCGGSKWPPYSSGSAPGIAAITDQGLESPVCPSGPPGEPNGTSQTVSISEDPPGKGGLAAAASEEKRPTILPKKGREKLASLLADLMGLSDSDTRTRLLSRDRTGAPGLYMSMSSVLGPGPEREPVRTSWLGAPPPTTTSRRESAVIYESCLKCIGARCHAPPRLPSSLNRNGSSTSLDAGVGPLGSLGPLAWSGPFRRGGTTTDATAPSRGALRLRARACGATSGGERRHDDVTFGPSVADEEKRTPNEEEICWGGLPANEAVERSSEAEEKAKCELLGSSGPSRYLQEPEGAVFAFPAEGPVPERPWAGDGVTYVNIPISPTSKKQLNYMELEIQETGAPGFRGPGALLPAQRTKGGSSTRYAHIDITATETAHKVGTQHALGRQEGLHTLEFRRRGAPQ
ncbi:protein Dok-7-like isoform X1 [Gadus chalcogrammus]|uniref:protein Dok-7-like isoform X1 n=1 Tax=Gadus chalcogrammus TaxID=1042646 RepID=UPI0024C4CC6B|nr:protein Dok-7-like isoform X1 [Gadus chalcogrammus]